MRERNWCQYNKELVERGSLTFLLDPKTLKDLNPKKQKKAGRPLEFSDQLIQILVMIKIHYRLTYRALEGFTKDLLEKLKKIGKMPTYSLTCKRAKTLK
ncbi:MAG TPA: transposase [Chlamydiales bacterium]|nr:transposase [Chlamydiales bacterium]